MADLARVNVAWQNFPGAPGLSQFFFANTAMQTSVDALRTFFDAVKATIPTGTTITVPGTGDLVDEATGTITGTWSVTTPPTVITCTGAGAYAGNAGLVVHWLTPTVIRGRRVRGRTFLVPQVATSYETNGSISASVLTTVNAAAAALLTNVGSNFRIWSRPQPATPAHPAYSGGNGNVNAYRVPDLAVSLRSRRI